MNGKLHQPLSPAAAGTQAPALQPRAPVSLHIDRLVLEGLPIAAAERSHLQAAVMAELEALFAAGAISPDLRRSAALQGLRLDDLRFQSGAAAEQIGRQIARALHRGIGS